MNQRLTIAEVFEVDLALTPPIFCNNAIYIMMSYDYILYLYNNYDHE